MALIQTIDLPFRTAALIAAMIACVGVVLLLWRRRTLGGWAAGLLCVALGLIPLAAGGLRIGLPGDAKVLVLVDESASTRGARYREEAFLRDRIAELLGPARFEVRRFGETDGRTVLPELGASPVLLFSDGQFALPEGGPAVYAVADPELDGPNDAQVVGIHPERGEAIAVLANGGGTRQVVLDGRPAELPQGRYRIALGDATRPHRVEIGAGDRWPENDRMDSLGEGPEQLELWNVGLPEVAGFRPMAVADLPGEAEGYLRCAMLAVDAGTAGELSPAQQSAIGRFVRDLGGSLVLVGTDGRWADLRGQTIGGLSPLAVDPPEPQAQWTVLLDASGSMAQSEGGVIKWQEALAAARVMVRGIPGNDPVRIGSFAQDVRWWSAGTAGVVDLRPPAGLAPHGPTNLVPALSAALAESAGGERQLLLLTDAEVEIADVEGWIGRMRSSGMRVSCLVLADGRGRQALESLCRGTGGQVLMEADPRKWATAARELAGRVGPTRWVNETASVQMRWPLPEGNREVMGWNAAWLRQGATAAVTGDQKVLGAWWRTGVGTVTAVAWWPREAAMAAVAANTRAKASSERYEVQWPADPEGAVKVTAASGAPVPALRVAAIEGGAREIAMRLVAPGEYEAVIPDAWRGAYVTAMASGDVVARRAIAPGYEPEFAHIGTNRANLEELASRTGGRVVQPDERGPLPIRLPQRWRDLSSLCGLAAITLASAAVILLRRRM